MVQFDTTFAVLQIGVMGFKGTSLTEIRGNMGQHLKGLLPISDVTKGLLPISVVTKSAMCFSMGGKEERITLLSCQ